MQAEMSTILLQTNAADGVTHLKEVEGVLELAGLNPLQIRNAIGQATLCGRASCWVCGFEHCVLVLRSPTGLTVQVSG